MEITSERRIDALVERHVVIDGIPGMIWTPQSASTSAPPPIILLGHPGGLARMYPRLAARARRAADDGFATATIELPGSGDRQRLPAVDQARADLRRALEAHEPVTEDIVDRLILPLVDTAAPEWQRTLDTLLSIPEIGGPVGYSGGVIALGIRLAVREPRIAAAGLFAGSYVPGPPSKRRAGSPSRCTCCCSGTTTATIGTSPCDSSMPSAPGRRPCRRTSGATQAFPRSPARTPPGSSLATSRNRHQLSPLVDRAPHHGDPRHTDHPHWNTSHAFSQEPAARSAALIHQ